QPIEIAISESVVDIVAHGLQKRVRSTESGNEIPQVGTASESNQRTQRRNPCCKRSASPAHADGGHPEYRHGKERWSQQHEDLRPYLEQQEHKQRGYDDRRAVAGARALYKDESSRRDGQGVARARACEQQPMEVEHRMAQAVLHPRWHEEEGQGEKAGTQSAQPDGKRHTPRISEEEAQGQQEPRSCCEPWQIEENLDQSRKHEDTVVVERQRRSGQQNVPFHP